jgi:hypothetical protein
VESKGKSESTVAEAEGNDEVESKEKAKEKKEKEETERDDVRTMETTTRIETFQQKRTDTHLDTRTDIQEGGHKAECQRLVRDAKWKETERKRSKWA